MKVCNCTLNIFNPEACKNCINMEFQEISYPWLPISPTAPITPLTPVYPNKMVKRITRTIEKYGPAGEYLGKEVITEDQEDIEVPDYSYPPQPYYDYPIIISDELTGTISVSGSNNFTNTDKTDLVSSSFTQYDSNTPFTYTQN